MAVNIPKNLKRTGKGTPPAPAATHHNLSKPANGKKIPIQLNVPAEVRRDFLRYAVDHDLNLSDLFEAIFEWYKENHG